MSVTDDSPKTEGVIVITSDGLSAETMILKILGLETLPDALICSDNIKGYPWIFDTKYYAAEINLYVLEEKSALSTSFLNSIKAIILYFDSQKLSSFGDILNWMPYLIDLRPEVQLLVCNNLTQASDSSVLQRKNIVNWCIQTQFELVELNPTIDSDDEDDSTFIDAKGYDRIIQALQSHTWANLEMKIENSAQCRKLKKEKQLEKQKEGNSQENISNTGGETASNTTECESRLKAEASKKVTVENEELLLEEKWLSSVLGGDDSQGESFEALFAKFASMKDRASGLTGDERKKYAEKVAIAFWRAMGGDEDEIDGLDDE